MSTEATSKIDFSSAKPGDSLVDEATAAEIANAIGSDTPAADATGDAVPDATEGQPSAPAEIVADAQAAQEAVASVGEDTHESVGQTASEAPVIATSGTDVNDLMRQKEELEAKIEAESKAQRATVVAEIVKVVNTYKIPVAELVDALGGLKRTRKGSKAKAKYRDPSTGKEWSGRGKEPLWIKGKNRDEFLITE